MVELVINEAFTKEVFLKQLTLKDFKVIILFMSNINLFELSYNYPIKRKKHASHMHNAMVKSFFLLALKFLQSKI